MGFWDFLTGTKRPPAVTPVTLIPGQVYNYRFDTREIKQPIQDAVTSCRWTYKGVAFGKL